MAVLIDMAMVVFIVAVFASRIWTYITIATTSITGKLTLNVTQTKTKTNTKSMTEGITVHVTIITIAFVQDF